MAYKVQLIITPPKRGDVRELTLLADRAHDAKPAMHAILDMLRGTEAREFESSGRAGGKPWKADTPEWQKRKADAGKSTKPERYTDALMLSLTAERAPGAIRRVNRQSAVLGTTYIYSRYQKGRTLLARLRFTPGVYTSARDILVNWLMEGHVT
jgi:hypothetical protein